MRYEPEPIPDDELTEFERDWINRLSLVMAEGFGSTARTGRNHYYLHRQVRSGVYRGVISTLVPIYDEMADKPQGGTLFRLGNEAAKKALWDNRVCPDQT